MVDDIGCIIRFSLEAFVISLQPTASLVIAERELLIVL